jgi:membrane dipeptidase
LEPYLDRRSDPSAWARELGVSRAAIDLYLDSDVIDLHVDSFIWHRVLGYDIRARHRPMLFRGLCFGQADLPRVREACITGATWVITTNPLGLGAERIATLERNVRELSDILLGEREDVALVSDLAEYEAARAAGLHAAFLGIQGGNALAPDPSVLSRLGAGRLLRVTLMHLSNSEVGGTSAPAFGDGGLGARGVGLVQALDEARVFVDLAHAGKRTFWDTVAAHDKSLPLAATHTGVSGVKDHWRNLDDRQIRAIADTGGVVGVIYHGAYLGDGLFSGRAESIVRHLEHLRAVAGDDIGALGSDWDGAIVTPRDMPTCLELPRLVDIMLRRRWPEPAIVKVLGGNFLRALGDLRGRKARRLEP